MTVVAIQLVVFGAFCGLLGAACGVLGHLYAIARRRRANRVEAPKTLADSDFLLDRLAHLDQQVVCGARGHRLFAARESSENMFSFRCAECGIGYYQSAAALSEAEKVLVRELETVG